MAALTYLSDDIVRAGRTVKDDPECDEILQELRMVTGEDWLVRVIERPMMRFGPFGTKPKKTYYLYADCHGEWQVINMPGPDGGSVFAPHPESRTAVMNFMQGIICGVQNERRAATRKDTP